MKKTQAALAAVGVAALAGGGTAIAAKGHTHAGVAALSAAAPPAGRHGPPGLAAAAGYLGTTATALRLQLQAGATLARIADATSGKSASGLIDALVADARTRFGANVPLDLRQRITELVNGVARHERGPGGGLQAAAGYLGTTPEALRTQLAGGKTLAEIANATSGKSAQGLIDALVTDARTHITRLVNGT
ncbi:MAG TPA: hypothetical protein VGK79_05230 [Gaiellaceae bacterium]